MHVALNALFLDPPMGGLEAYVRHLSAALLERRDPPRLSIYATPRGAEKLAREPWASEAEIVVSPRMGARGLRALSELTALGAIADARRADIVHSLAMTGPLTCRAARVVTIADTTWLTHPSAGSATQALWRRAVPLVAKRSDEVIAISEAGAREIQTHIGVPSDRLSVTPLGSGLPPTTTPTPAEHLANTLGLGPGPIVLNVGQRGVHRNLLRLVDAVAALQESVPGTQLVLPGYCPPELDKPLRDRAEARGITELVHFVGYVSQEDLEGLYRAAAAFAMPSMVEGFGLPVLEAMQRGTPVACSAGSAPSEVLGDAGLTFDPADTTSITAALLRLIEDDDLRATLATAGPKRAAAFSWQDCAERTLTVYERALA